jgi:uncharacterized protein GlcG (DUF336 family)
MYTSCRELDGNPGSRRWKTLDCVQKLVAGALAKANADFHRPICVSVCDQNGFLVAFVGCEYKPAARTEEGLRWLTAVAGKKLQNGKEVIQVT